MNIKIKQRLFAIYYETKQRFIHVIKYMWFVEIKNKWNKLYIRKDEFHNSLDLDIEVMKCMNKEERDKYIIGLIKRRNIAHEHEIG